MVNRQQQNVLTWDQGVTSNYIYNIHVAQTQLFRKEIDVAKQMPFKRITVLHIFLMLITAGHFTVYRHKSFDHQVPAQPSFCA